MARGMLRKFNSFNAVAAGAVANVSVPVAGPTYGLFILELTDDSALATTAEFASLVELIKIKLNGDEVVEMTGAELVNLNTFYGYPQVTGGVPLMWRRPEFLDPLEEMRFALGTADLGSCTIEVTLASGATSPQLRAFGEVIPGAPRKLGQIVKISSQNYGSQAAAGVLELHDLTVRGPASIANFNSSSRGVKALHLTAANVTDHKLILNGNPYLDAPKVLQDLYHDINGFQTVGRTPVSGWYHLDLAGNRYSGIVGTTNATDFSLELTFDDANAAYKIIKEEVIGDRDM